jgi:hypothetical protein
MLADIFTEVKTKHSSAAAGTVRDRENEPRTKENTSRREGSKDMMVCGCEFGKQQKRKEKQTKKFLLRI